MTRQPEIQGAQIPPIQRVSALLRGRPFVLTHTDSLLPYVLSAGGLSQRVRVHLRDEAHVRQFLFEIEAHLAAPKPWHAPFPLTPLAPVWTAGYMAAAKHCLSWDQPFHSALTALAQHLACSYRLPAERQAYRSGAAHYFHTVRNISHDLNDAHPQSDGKDHHEEDAAHAL